MKNLFVFAVIFFVPVVMSSQNENSKWFFGKHGGIDFMTSPPSVITHTTMNTTEGTASIADAAGNLLFYTDGSTIWNKQMLVMSNGTGLLGHFSTAQAALIVKKPSSTVEYFVFTLDLQGGSNGLRYSIVDMSLASGLGAVTLKNIPIASPCTEQLTGTYHCNGYDVWVVTHDFTTNLFLSYLVTSAGINTTAVVSAVGPTPPTHSVTNNAYGQGVIKISNTGEKLGLTFWNGTPNNEVALFDFNNNTGIVSNYISLIITTTNNYGCEFSPDGSKFYSSSTQSQGVFQWDVCAGSPSLVVASISTVGLAQNGNLQLAPNGKIYMARSTQTLSVINNPNAAGLACNFSTLGIALPTATINAGLPAFISGRGRPVPVFTYSSSTQGGCEAKTFSATSPTISSGCPGTSTTAGILWDFGDPASGALNTSTLSSPSHIFTSTGTYTVRLMLSYPCGTDTILQIIPITQGPSVTASASSPTLCAGNTAMLTAHATGSSGPYTYSWVGGPSGSTFVTTSQTAGTVNYILNVTDQQGCQKTLSVPVVYLSRPTLSAQGATVCAGSPATLTVSGAGSYTWLPANTNGSMLTVQATATSVYTVSGSIANGCTESKTVQITVKECVGIAERNAASPVRVYPLYVTDLLTIEIGVDADISLYNITGILAKQLHVPAGKTRVDISDLPAGVYLVSGKEIGVKRIIKYD